MKFPRYWASLSGLAAQLIAIGGHNHKNLKICEKYQITLNKWKELPPLKTPRVLAGSILLPSLRAFCFGGQGAPS